MLIKIYLQPICLSDIIKVEPSSTRYIWCLFFEGVCNWWRSICGHGRRRGTLDQKNHSTRIRNYMKYLPLLERVSSLICLLLQF